MVGLHKLSVALLPYVYYFRCFLVQVCPIVEFGNGTHLPCAGRHSSANTHRFWFRESFPQ